MDTPSMQALTPKKIAPTSSELEKATKQRCVLRLEYLGDTRPRALIVPTFVVAGFGASINPKYDHRPPEVSDKTDIPSYLAPRARAM